MLTAGASGVAAQVEKKPGGGWSQGWGGRGLNPAPKEQRIDEKPPESGMNGKCCERSFRQGGHLSEEIISIFHGIELKLMEMKLSVYLRLSIGLSTELSFKKLSRDLSIGFKYELKLSIDLSKYLADLSRLLKLSIWQSIDLSAQTKLSMRLSTYLT